MQKKTNFETKTCTRCHGSGRHSYCQMYGDTCFKCGGSGIVLTKRGSIAKAYFIEISSVPASELKAGDRVYTNGITSGGQYYSYIGTVTNIQPSKSMGSGSGGNMQAEGDYKYVIENGTITRTTLSGGILVQTTDAYLDVSITHEKYGDSSVACAGSNKMRVYRADQHEKLAQALKYQESLTKTGKPRRMKK